MKYAYLVWTNLQREGKQDQKHVLGVHTSKKSAMGHYVSVFDYWKSKNTVLEKAAIPEEPESFATVSARNLGGCRLTLAFEDTCEYLDLWIERRLAHKEEKKK